MSNVNLLLSFKLADDPAVQVRGAARIEVARGRLTVYDSKTGLPEHFPIAQVKSFRIHNPGRESLLGRTA